MSTQESAPAYAPFPQPPFGFHSQGGWHFRREPDGSVTIAATTADGQSCLQFVTLDPGTWASAVASVSAAGETGETFRAAERFHAGGADAT